MFFRAIQNIDKLSTKKNKRLQTDLLLVPCVHPTIIGQTSLDTTELRQVNKQILKDEAVFVISRWLGSGRRTIAHVVQRFGTNKLWKHIEALVSEPEQNRVLGLRGYEGPLLKILRKRWIPHAPYIYPCRDFTSRLKVTCRINRKLLMLVASKARAMLNP